MTTDYESGRSFLRSDWKDPSAGWVSDQKAGLPPPEQAETPADGERLFPLPPAAELPDYGKPLGELLRKRKSRRKYNIDLEISMEELSFLCWAAAGIRERHAIYSFRTYPSGGSRHPFDLFVYIARAAGLTAGLYRYLPFEHALGLAKGGDLSDELDEALFGQYWGAAAVFVWAAVPYRTEWRYGNYSHKIIALDAGHACQNLYLACEAVGAGTCAIGAYDQAKLDQFLGIDGRDRFALYAAPVGKP